MGMEMGGKQCEGGVKMGGKSILGGGNGVKNNQRGNKVRKHEGLREFSKMKRNMKALGLRDNFRNMKALGLEKFSKM